MPVQTVGQEGAEEKDFETVRSTGNAPLAHIGLTIFDVPLLARPNDAVHRDKVGKIVGSVAFSIVSTCVCIFIE